MDLTAHHVLRQQVSNCSFLCLVYQNVTVCFPTRCMVTVAFVMRQPASAPVNQELVGGSVIDATKMPTIRVEDVLVSKVFHNPSVIERAHDV